MLSGYVIGYRYVDEEGLIPEFYEKDLISAQATTNLLNRREQTLHSAFAVGCDFMRENHNQITQHTYTMFRNKRDELILLKLKEHNLQRFSERTLRGEFFRYTYVELKTANYLEIT